MKNFKRILILILSIIPAIYTAASVLFFLPDKVALHFNVNGSPDRYGSKYEAFILPAIILVMYAAYKLYSYFVSKTSDEDGESLARRLDITDTIFTAILVLFNTICGSALYAMADPSIVSESGLFFTVLSAVMGVVFIVMGNIMPKTKRNSAIGMRVSFTMDTDEHWYIGNRAGGIAMVVTGLITVIAGVVLHSIVSEICMIISLIVSVTVAIIYSYVKIRGKKSND